jgi:two-component system cell cycle sensor histidine kinase/response regulator CckA
MMNTTQWSASTPSATDDRQGPGGVLPMPATILLVDDAEILRELIKLVLGASGYTLLETKDGEACVKMAQEYAGPIHLLLADMFLPRITGREVADRVLPLHQQMKVLLMSGQQNEEVKSHGGFGPGFGFMRKPFTPDTLRRKVAEALGQ